MKPSLERSSLARPQHSQVLFLKISQGKCQKKVHDVMTSAISAHGHFLLSHVHQHLVPFQAARPEQPHIHQAFTSFLLGMKLPRPGLQEGIKELGLELRTRGASVKPPSPYLKCPTVQAGDHLPRLKAFNGRSINTAKKGMDVTVMV